MLTLEQIESGQEIAFQFELQNLTEAQLSALLSDNEALREQMPPHLSDAEGHRLASEVLATMEAQRQREAAESLARDAAVIDKATIDETRIDDTSIHQTAFDPTEIDPTEIKARAHPADGLIQSTLPHDSTPSPSGEAIPPEMAPAQAADESNTNPPLPEPDRCAPAIAAVPAEDIVVEQEAAEPAAPEDPLKPEYGVPQPPLEHPAFPPAKQEVGTEDSQGTIDVLPQTQPSESAPMSRRRVLLWATLAIGALVLMGYVVLHHTG